MTKLLTTLVMGCQLLTTWPKLCYGSPVLDGALMSSHEPEIVEMYSGKRVMSPDTPYAAASARNAIYFIDQRFDIDSAKHIKEQLENLVANENGYWYIDEVAVTAERRDPAGITLFTFNPAYARVFFAESMNSRNPSLNLPVHEPAGEWLVVYDIAKAEVGGKAKRIGTDLSPRKESLTILKRDDCDDLDCNTNNDCKNQDKYCDSHDHGTIENGCRDGGLVNAVGRCALGGCKAAFDTPRFVGQTDATYYQRIDKLHWN